MHGLENGSKQHCACLMTESDYYKLLKKNLLMLKYQLLHAVSKFDSSELLYEL